MASHISQSEEVPSWERLANCLKVVLDDFELDLSQVGKAQRLSYEDFESIFYHLFLLIDPGETRRRFRFVEKARSTEDRNRMFELITRFINDKQLSAQRATTAQLRALRGGPFRRLLESLIKGACDGVIERSGDPPQASFGEPGEPSPTPPEALIGKLREKTEAVQGEIEKFRNSAEQLKSLRKRVEESNGDVLVKRSSLRRLLPQDETGDSTSQSIGGPRDVTRIVHVLLTRVETAHARTKAALEKIQSIELPPEERGFASAQGSAVKKRLSQFIRETTHKYDSSQDLSPEANRTKLNEGICQQLVRYDQELEGLMSVWRQEEEKADEELLKDPKIAIMYEELGKLIPLIDLKPIRATKNEYQDESKQESQRPSLAFIREMNELFPDDRYDDEEILKISMKYFK